MEQLSISPRTIKILAVFIETEQPLYVREIGRKISLPPATVSRILQRLIRQELVSFQIKGNLKLFQLNQNHPLLPEIKSLAQKQAGQIPLIKQQLGRLPQIKQAFIYGSAAGGQLTSTSDIDLVIIGNPPVDDLNQDLNQLEKTLGREINYSLFSEAEFTKQKSLPGFLQYILNQPHQVILGKL